MAIHQDVTINAGPTQIYRALTGSKEFSEFTGAPAAIEADEGGAFSCFDGKITGRNIELDLDTMIVQAWRVEGWPAGVYSIVRFTLEKAGAATKLTLDHAGFPADFAEHLEGGWHKMYWEPLKAYCK